MAPAQARTSDEAAGRPNPETTTVLSANPIGASLSLYGAEVEHAIGPRTSIAGSASHTNFVSDLHCRCLPGDKAIVALRSARTSSGRRRTGFSSAIGDQDVRDPFACREDGRHDPDSWRQLMQGRPADTVMEILFDLEGEDFRTALATAQEHDMATDRTLVLARQ